MLLRRVFTALCFASFVVANVEKIIFTAGDLDRTTCLDVEKPAFALSSAVLSSRVQWKGLFPDDIQPRGQKIDGVLSGLDPGQRYELRVCWPATFPSDFYFERFCTNQGSNEGLSIFMTRTYYSTNSTKMVYPEPVPIELTLDPYVFNLIPQSLITVIGYICALLSVAAITARPLSTFVRSLGSDTEDLKKQQ